jgi:hypothetical protein
VLLFAQCMAMATALARDSRDFKQTLQTLLILRRRHELQSNL